MTEQIVVADNSNTAEEVVLETTEETSETVENNQETVETVDEVKAKLTKAEELANNYKIRAEKAEKLNKTVKPVEVKSENISTSDILALSKANLHEDDIQEVQDYAKYKKISIAEALKSNVIKTLLADKEENRKVASATNTGNARRSPTKVTDEVILEKAKKGEEVETDDVVNARWNIKRAKFKK